ncbi:hypothetical protein MAC_08971 [Metarhizium acridum CQMa 102]|uniref:Uncharacterized protein n=1 Tax=Metarhizium acridum (strain CQMa 102) TaxID=655827 RepID=E9EGH3_METAQ|nr:uncharacterized protein MAC_08971 [Metarhizium acridum CQMa 102]EFY84987.1 hypothetical protein MAC_08971 [Metarhizium acridum CQMa 102]
MAEQQIDFSRLRNRDELVIDELVNKFLLAADAPPRTPDRREKIIEFFSCIQHFSKTGHVLCVFTTLIRLASCIPHDHSWQRDLATVFEQMFENVVGWKKLDEFEKQLEKRWIFNPWCSDEQILNDIKTFQVDEWINLNAFVAGLYGELGRGFSSFASSGMSLALDTWNDKPEEWIHDEKIFDYCWRALDSMDEIEKKLLSGLKFVIDADENVRVVNCQEELDSAHAT